MSFHYCNLHGHSGDGSLLDGYGSCKNIVKRVKETGSTAFALTDHGGIASAVKAEQEAKKANLKYIRGIEIYVCEGHSHDKSKENGALSHLCILAKNLEGWKSILKLVEYSNSHESFYRKPRLSLDELRQFASDGNLISFAGHGGSVAANQIFSDYKRGYSSRSHDEVLQYLHPDWEKRLERKLYELRDIFGKENFFGEIQLIDKDNFIAAQLLADCVRHVAKKIGMPCVASADSHYPDRSDAPDQRVMLCSALKTTMNKVNIALENDEEVGLGAFFRSSSYHLPGHDEMMEVHAGFEEEVANSNLIADMCEDYTILGPPRIPKFDCPDGKDADTYLREICREGWKKLIVPIIEKSPDLKDTYAERIKYELDLISKGRLSDYFLIVSDYVNFSRNRGALVGRGRGSAGGCLTSWLAGIIGLDPIEHGLYFERFLSPARIEAGVTPDVDCDFQVQERPRVMSYIKNKYGHNKVAGIANFGRLMGRGAVKEVLRVFQAASFDEMNAITDYLEDEAAISDDLNDMGDDASIIKYGLINESKGLSPWVRLEDDGSLSGPMAKYFEIAMRIEGTRKSMGQHASGYVIADVPLSDFAPMVRSKSGEDLIVGWENADLEPASGVKFDLLSVVAQDILKDITDTVRMGNYAT